MNISCQNIHKKKILEKIKNKNKKIKKIKNKKDKQMKTIKMIIKINLIIIC